MKDAQQIIYYLAEHLYTTYCEKVGGKAFNGDNLPTWEGFSSDPTKQKQAQAWIAVAESAVEIFYRRHVFWGAGEPDCPKEIKAPNGEIHSMRCKVCGMTNPRDRECRPAFRKTT